MAASGFSAALSLCGLRGIGGDDDDGFWVIARMGLRGFFVGSLFGLHYVFKRRWVLNFPIIQVLLHLFILANLYLYSKTTLTSIDNIYVNFGMQTHVFDLE